jgi:hypothetical protein
LLPGFVQEEYNQCLQAELDYVASSRKEDVASSPEWAVVSLSGIQGWWGRSQVAVRVCI